MMGSKLNRNGVEMDNSYRMGRGRRRERGGGGGVGPGNGLSRLLATKSSEQRAPTLFFLLLMGNPRQN